MVERVRERCGRERDVVERERDEVERERDVVERERERVVVKCICIIIWSFDNGERGTYDRQPDHDHLPKKKYT